MKENEIDEETKKVFSHALAADTLGHHTGCKEEIESQIKKDLNKVLPDAGIIKLIGAWDLVWGPGVYQHGCPDFAANSFYVVKSKTSNPEQYVVAIAGTVEDSLYTWLAENLDIFETCDWEYGPKKGEWISKGSWTGLKHLQEIKPSQGMKKSGVDIFNFLKDEFKNKQNQAELIIAGHSLGGNLAAVFALWLADIKGTWDPNNKSTIKIYSSAGASPGNEKFAEYFDNKFKDHAHRIWNNLDVIPHAWNLDTMRKIPGLYLPARIYNIPVSLLVLGLLYELCRHSRFYYHVPKNAPPLSGKIKNKNILDPFVYFKEMLYQHIEAYIPLLQVEAFFKEFERLTKLKPGAHLALQATDKNLEAFTKRWQELYLSDTDYELLARLSKSEAPMKKP